MHKPKQQILGGTRGLRGIHEKWHGPCCLMLQYFHTCSICASETRQAHVKCMYNRIISGWIMGQNIKHSETRTCRYTSVNWAVISLVWLVSCFWPNYCLSQCWIIVNLWNLNQSTKMFFLRYCIWKCRLQDVGQFASAPMCWKDPCPFPLEKSKLEIANVW